jgi:glycosyltransferase involved in cell wall biosynthesis
MNGSRLGDVTVVVVSYNHELFLGDLLQSVESQTVSPARLIICDDASTDGSAALIREYSRRSSLATQLHLSTENIGLTRTLNRAISEVATPYFAYISGDDVMAPRRLELQLAHFEAATSNCAFVYSDALRIDAAGRTLAKTFFDVFRPEVVTDSFANLLRGNWIPAASVIMRTEAVRQVGGYDEGLFFEDHDMWLRLAREYSFTSVPEPLVSYRELDSSLGHRKFRDHDNDWQWAKVHIRAKHLGADPETDRVIADLILPWLITLAERGEDPRRLAPLFRSGAASVRSPAYRAWASVATHAPWALGIVARARRNGSA